MKIILSVAREMIDEVEDWHECQAVRLSENHDGSFTLEMTEDLETSRLADAEVKRGLDSIRKLVGGTNDDG